MSERRYDAHQEMLDDGRGDDDAAGGGAGLLGSSPSQSNAGWVGAFERVLGDTTQEHFTSAKPATSSKARSTTNAGFSGESHLVPQHVGLRSASHLAPHLVGSDRRDASSLGYSSTSSSLVGTPLGLEELRGGSPARDYLTPRRRRSSSAAAATKSGWASTSDGISGSGAVHGGAHSSDGSWRSHSRASSKGQGQRAADMGMDAAQATPRAPSQPGEERSSQQQHMYAAEQALARHSSPAPATLYSTGKPLIETDLDRLAFEDLYLNHAPGMQPLLVRNRSDGESVLVRIESDLGRGVMFLKRKRATQDARFDGVSWPSNSVIWARHDGLSPDKLRELRHMTANLEPADSFILEPSQSAELFVSFRPIHFVTENDPRGGTAGPSAQHQPPRSPTFEVPSSAAAASTSPSRPSTAAGPDFHSGSRSSSQSSLLTAPTSAHGGVAPSGTDSAAASAGTMSPQSTPSLYKRPDSGVVTFRTFSVSGTVTLRAWPMVTPGIVAPSAGNAEDGGDALAPSTNLSSAASNLSSTSSTRSRPTSFYSSTLSSSAPTSDVGDEEPQMMRLPLTARTCRPQIAVATAPAGQTAQVVGSGTAPAVGGRPRVHGLVTIDFGDIFAGQRDERVLTLLNASEIECLWQARVEDAENMLSACPISLPGVSCVHAADPPAAQFKPNALPPLATQPLRFIFAPTEPCRDYEQVVTLTNLHNSSNSVRVMIRANILATARDDSLRVLSGDTLDFGDCSGGHWTKQLLVLKNVGDAVLDLAFSTQPGFETVFQLAELAPQVEEVHQEAPPALIEPLSGESSAAASDASSSRPESESGHSEGLGAPRQAARPASPSASTSSVASTSASPMSQSVLSARRAAALENARTPTSHPQPMPQGAEPPFFELPGAGVGPSLVALRAVPEASLRADATASSVGSGCGSGYHRDRDDDDEVDASSVASNAGSLSDSPTRSRASQSQSSNAQSLPLGAAASSNGSGGPHHGSSTSGLVFEPTSHSEGGSAAPSRPGLHPTLRPSPSRNRINQLRGEASVGGGGSSAVSSGQSRLLPGSSGTAPVSAAEDSGSARSEITGFSSGGESRLAPFAASSAGSVILSASGGRGGSSGKGPRAGPGIALSGLRSVEQGHGNQLEELVLRPGGEYRVVVSFRPARGDVDAAFTAGRLVEQSFRISLDYSRARTGGTRARGGRERRTILCRARTCTSFITVSPQLIDLGETNVGTRKTAAIAVTNHSELTARVDLRFDSKVLSMYRDEVAIPALQTVELRLDFFPRRINEAYRKQITIANILNRSNDQIFEVRSRNVDKQRVSFHSLFYRILTPSGANYIDFGDVNINSSRVRTFAIENTSAKRLALELSAANGEDLKLYVKASGSSPKSGAAGSSKGGSSKERANAAQSGSPGAETGNGEQGTLDGPGRAPVSQYAELEAPDSVLSKNAHLRPTKQGSTGADLKERFLETLSGDAPASVRRENASWRLAQQRSHVRQGKDGASKASNSRGAAAREAGSTANGASSSANDAASRKTPKSLAATLKKGGKGRPTVKWGRSVMLKDRTLLSDAEYLDLATGPSIDYKRISAKSKKWQTIELLETGSKPKLAGAANKSSTTSALSSSKAAAAAAAAAAAGGSASTNADGSGSSSRGSSGDAATGEPSSKAKKSKSSIVTPRKLPQALAADIVDKQGSPSSRGGDEGRGGSTAGDAGDKRSPALTAKRKGLAPLANSINVSKLTTEELLAALEGLNSDLSTFFLSNPEAEERSVRTEINLQRELSAAIASGRIVPVDVVSIQPGQERQIIAIFSPNGSTRPHIQGTARKQDSRIFLRLVDFDVDAVRSSSEFRLMADLDREELPVRDLMVRSTTCRSLVELGQPHINFGHVEKGDTRTRRILIQNRSEWALRYAIRKSGSIASGDIRIRSGSYGVVPGHGKREVEFIFSPSLSGPFQERLTIENVADRDCDQTVFLKAMVRKSPNFVVEPEGLDFGGVEPGRLTAEQSFVVTNTTPKARTFVVAVDPHDLRHQRSIVDVILRAASEEVKGLSKEEEEEVERISQKLKIAIRKGQQEKVDKYTTRLAELGITNSSDDPASNAATPSDVKPPPSAIETPATPAAQPLKRVSSTVTLRLEGGQSKRLLVSLRPRVVSTVVEAAHSSDDAASQAAEEVGLRVEIHEVKNRDETRTVDIRASVRLDVPAQCQAHYEEQEQSEALQNSVVFTTQTAA